METFERHKCKMCKENYGSEGRGWLCSICFKVSEDLKLVKEKDQTVKMQEQKADEVIPNRPIQQNKYNCWFCEKKVGHLGFKCDCLYIFCKTHRHFSDHNCDYDPKTKKIITK
jgi:hypothetical protein